MGKNNNSSAPSRATRSAPAVTPPTNGRGASFHRKPLVVAVAVGAATTTIVLVVLLLLRASGPARPPAPTETTPACPEAPRFADPSRKDVYEMSAAALLRAIWAAPAAQKERLLLDLHKDHHNSQAMAAVRTEYENLPSVRAAAEKERAVADAQTRQQKASEALNFALKVAENDQGKLKKLLGQVVADHPGTPAAEEADKRLRDIAGREKAAKDAQESLTRLAAAKETAKTDMNQALRQMEAIAKELPGTPGAAQAAKFRDDELRRREQAARRREQEQADMKTIPEELAKFLPGYRDALRAGDLEEAVKLARQWRATTPNLVAKRLSFVCEADIQLLRAVNAKVGEYLKDYAPGGNKNGKFLSVISAKGKKLTITVIEVNGAEFRFHVRDGNTLDRDYGAYLSPETRLDFYDKKRGDDPTPPALSRWLVLYAAGSAKAGKAWEEAKEHDPRRRDHALILEHSK